MTQAGVRGDAIAVSGLLVSALLLGGGNWLFPLYRLVVELAAVLVFAWFSLRSWRRPENLSTWVAGILLMLAMLLLLVQIVPLPPETWHRLPGRELALSVYTAVGEPDRSAPISLDPSATRDVIAFFFVPITMFVAALWIGRMGQRQLLQIVAAFCLLNALLVTVQFQGFAWLTPYTSYGRPGTGLFANKNHCALFLVMSMPAVAWAIMEGQSKIVAATTRRWAAIAAIGFVSLTVFGCLSRAGLALLPIAFVASSLIVAPPTLRRRQVTTVFGGFALILLLLAVVLPHTAVVAQALARFDAQSDLRYQFWPVVVDGIKAYFPVGSGFGTFRPVFAALEPLSIVKPTFVNNAHSDYLEIALEGGIAGILLIFAFFVWFMMTAVVRLWVCRRGSTAFPPIVIAVAGIVELLLHSIVDYPLRTLALASLTIVYCAILAIRPSALDLQKINCYRGKNRRRTRSSAGQTAQLDS